VKTCVGPTSHWANVRSLHFIEAGGANWAIQRAVIVPGSPSSMVTSIAVGHVAAGVKYPRANLRDDRGRFHQRNRWISRDDVVQRRARGIVNTVTLPTGM